MKLSPINNVPNMVAMDMLCVFCLLLFTTTVPTDGCPVACTCPELTDISCLSKNLTAIPRDISKMATTLDFTNNFIDRVMGVELAGFRHLLTLNFENNLIQNVQDGAFQYLESLQELDLSHNRLAIVTEQSLVGVTHITTLDLSNNLIQHVDGTFSKMSQLTRLDLSYNQIQRISHVTFRDLKSLRYLLLSDNQISHIDKRAFRNLDQLMYLVLRGNQIDRVAKFEFNSRFLSYVDLSECGLEQIPRGLPATIRYLQLRKNNLTAIHRRSFRDCPHVSILVLDENGLVEIDDRTFENMIYLQQLWLNGNKLTHVPHPLPAGLQRLLMDQNRITQLTSVFPPNSQLHTLSLMGNNLTYVAYDAMNNLHNLMSLDLSENNISHIYGHTFLYLSNLTFLQLSKNPLTHFHSRSFWGLKNLDSMSLAYIDTVVSMHHDVFSHVTQLQKLNIDSSPWIVQTLLTSDIFTQSLSTLQDLSMQSCELTRLDADFPAFFQNLTTFHISSTRWHCDTHLLWFRDWILSTDVNIIKQDEITCFTPRKTHGRLIASLSDKEFVKATEPPSTMSTSSRPLSTFPSVGLTTTTQKASTRWISSTTATETVSTRTARTLVHNITESSASGTSQSDMLHGSTTTYSLHSSTLPPGIDFKIPSPGGDSTSRRHMSPEEWEEVMRPIQPPWAVSTDMQRPESDRQSTEPSSVETLSSTNSNNIKMIVIIAVTLSTVVIATVIITLIVYFLRKQNSASQQQSSKKDGVYQNGHIKYHHKNDVLYFMPNGKGKKSDSSSDSVKTSSTTKEQMALIPGRDINHEGPLRVYKWEDF